MMSSLGFAEELEFTNEDLEEDRKLRHNSHSVDKALRAKVLGSPSSMRFGGKKRVSTAVGEVRKVNLCTAIYHHTKHGIDLCSTMRVRGKGQWAMGNGQWAMG